MNAHKQSEQLVAAQALAVEGVNYVGDTLLSQPRRCWPASAETNR
jgi:hypothetical protein